MSSKSSWPSCLRCRPFIALIPPDTRTATLAGGSHVDHRSPRTGALEATRESPRRWFGRQGQSTRVAARCAHSSYRLPHMRTIDQRHDVLSIGCHNPDGKRGRIGRGRDRRWIAERCAAEHLINLSGSVHLSPRQHQNLMTLAINLSVAGGQC